MNFRPCFIVPCYNHGKFIEAVLAKLQAYSYPIIVIDDGSNAETAEKLAQLQPHFNLILHRHSQNCGKGGAIKTALYLAEIHGFSHALQVDADGQHQLSDIEKLLSYAKDHPETLVSANPIFDESVPKARYYGRYLTHFWVWLETLSLQIKDSMCGFRVYPVSHTLALIRNHFIGNKMDFDIEIIVQYYWHYRQVHFIPSQVIYPADGISHFDQLYDNLRLSRMHCRLLLQFWYRIPSLLMRKTAQKSAQPHWSKMQETGSIIGIRTLLAIYSLLGRKGFRLLLKPVILYYWLFSRTHRQASEAYLQNVQHYAKQQHLPLNQQVALTSFNHLSYFAESMLNKLIAWRGEISAADLNFHTPEEFDCEQLKGGLIIGSHLGDLELSRALGSRITDLKITALVFTKHAVRFNQLIQQQQSNQDQLEVLQVDAISPATLLLLQERVQQGHTIVLVGDRTSPNESQKSNQSQVDFLGQPAYFPHGPYILAHLLKVPVFLLFALRNPAQEGRFDIYIEPFAKNIQLPRQQREQAIVPYIQHYVERLTYYCLKSPLEWFNFFNFWHK
ncbi:glycosyltransferase [Gallibacterium trehalosifermentans]|uniref:Glycosyltransferase n=1 Tax=Gallibacterium trehalosifermentans TaxID=516935 RepID=A0ABV6H2N0_9PAST